jgi:hypothetical protein
MILACQHVWEELTSPQVSIESCEENLGLSVESGCHRGEIGIFEAVGEDVTQMEPMCRHVSGSP